MIRIQHIASRRLALILADGRTAIVSAAHLGAVLHRIITTRRATAGRVGTDRRTQETE